MAQKAIIQRSGKLTGQNRIRLLGLAYVAFFGVIGLQLVRLTVLEPDGG